MMNIICASFHTEMIWKNEQQHQQYAEWHSESGWHWIHAVSSAADELALILNSFFTTLDSDGLQNYGGNIKAAEAAAPRRAQTTHLT